MLHQPKFRILLVFFQCDLSERAVVSNFRRNKSRRSICCPYLILTDRQDGEASSTDKTAHSKSVGALEPQGQASGGSNPLDDQDVTNSSTSGGLPGAMGFQSHLLRPPLCGGVVCAARGRGAGRV
jgi:hypothetical protein